MALKNWNTNSLPIQTFRFLRKFSTETTQKVVFHLLSNQMEKLFVNLNTHNSLLPPCASRRRLGTSQRLYKIITERQHATSAFKIPRGDSRMEGKRMPFGKLKIDLQKKTNLGLDQAFFWPLKETIHQH